MGRDGGTGRRARLKIWWWKHRVGSIPTLGTNFYKLMILKKHLKELGDLLGEGHRRFGKVAPRRPYKEDDESGEGAPQLLFEEHPLLSQMPIGAPSDLTYLTQINEFSADKAQERVDELTLQLKNNLELQLGHKLGQQRKFTPPTLSPDA